MMEVKVAFLEKGLPATLGFSSYCCTERSIDSNYSQPMRLKWSFTSMRLIKSSVFLLMRTLEGNVTAVSSIKEMSRAIVFS